MGIIGRAQAVLASNFNALLSRLEEPGRDLAQLLNEMKEQVRAAERELVRTMGERKRSEAKIVEIDEQIAKWEKRAELAVQKGEDGLARDALAHKKRLITEREQLMVNRAAQQRAALDMKGEIERMRRIHRDYSSRQHTIATQVSVARAGGGVTGLGAKPGSNSFEAFENIERGIDAEEAQAVAEAEVDEMLDRTVLGTMTREQLDEEFRKLEGDAADRAGSTEPESGTANSAESGAADATEQPKTRIRIET